MSDLPPPIRSVDYNPVTATLLVRFRVGSYAFDKVPQAKASEFMLASSGCGENALAAFHSMIEGKYKSTRIGN